MRSSIAPRLGLLVPLVVLLVPVACSGAPASTSPSSNPVQSSAPTTAVTLCHTPAANEQPTTPLAVAIADRRYDPDPVQAKVGQAVQWTNEDSVPHTATLDDAECSTEQLSRGQVGVLVFTEAGTYAYHCRIHSSMHGTVTIAP